MNAPRFIRQAVRAVCLLLITSAFTGCIEWEHQVVRYRYDKQTDTLLIFQDYQGIYGADQPAQLSDTEIEQLDSVLRNQRTFFFANWIFEISLNTLEQLQADMRDNSGDSVAEDEERMDMLALLKVVIPNCSIQNGDFYLDDKRRISGVQRVQIRNISKILPRLNDAIRAAFKSEARTKPADVEAQMNYNQVADGKWTFVELQGNQIRVRFPHTAHFEEQDLKDVDLTEFAKSGIKISLKNRVTTATIGKQDDRITTIAYDPFNKPYRDNLLKHLKGKVRIQDSLNVEAVAEQFLAAR